MNYDVIISGGGLLGLITAIGLSHQSISVAVIEKNTLPRVTDDNRAFAIAQGSKQILERFGIWKFIHADAEPIFDICILDGNSPVSVHYNHKTVGSEPMGYVIDNSIIWSAINKCFLHKLNLYCPCSYKTISCDSGYVQVILDDSKKLISSLLICAEGKNSKLHELFSIPKVKFDYKQNSIVCNVTHELHHENLAVERFFPGGPFAILPMKGGYSSSIVWTEKSEISQMLMSLSPQEFIVELEKRFGSYLGTINLDSKIKSYPLNFAFAKNLYQNRVLLIGDTAHSIHPIAGQGLNLGIRDVDTAVRHIVTAKTTGIDIGSNYLLKKISRNQFCDNITMAAATDGLNRLFSNKIFCLKVLRNFGLMVVENSHSIKRRFIKHAMGLH
ncbi:2-octaprenyl-3-methyl-6-methoxy-1,4-benzoquinol hydroxylase [Wolbachia pipientis]|uniref:2-octaprenyl-3-methyl-6-methoxy-1,4-benzoquinol hydroxylase n=1 Tax=Wolbachia pipientis TaxID=955 RepID=A0A1E7QKR7_WOLPI|nr:2-octaprenyl-6-methoxyphenyl hydroxylase [Wolbachia pipientis]OEY87072.1 2-octaprenyl-3-methyl-6-methoxy-1,4-benzoquinol hydroxylase [Wolbachia pipientis]